MKKRFSVYGVALILIANITGNINAATDLSVLSEPVMAVYTGRDIGDTLIENITFSDVPPSHWAKEALTRVGALGIVKGDASGLYRPNDSVTKEEALAVLLRVVGQEESAKLAAEQIALTNGVEATTALWSKGYLQVARDLGLITNAQYTDGLTIDTTQLDPAVNFFRDSDISREQMAKWIVQSVQTVDPNQIAPNYVDQAMRSYSDWSQVGVEFAPYVETVIGGQIMVGDDGAFDPQGSLTRAELAQIIENMGDVLYNTMGLTRQGGIVAAISDDSEVNTLDGTLTRTYKVRGDDGLVYELAYSYSSDDSGLMTTKNAVVYQDGSLLGLNSLEEGDYLEYLVSPTSNEIYYIKNDGMQNDKTITGRLEPIVDLTSGRVAVETQSGQSYSYKMRAGLYDAVSGIMQIGGIPYPLADLPIGANVKLTIQNGIATSIDYVGEDALYNEISGIVTVHNEPLSYITLTTWDGDTVTKQYDPATVLVEKQMYYDENDEIGYIDQMFPDYRFDEKDASPSDIEAGDIIHLRLSAGDSNLATMISAKTNYVVKYGTVQGMTYKGAEGTAVTVVYEDGSTGVFTVNASIPVLKAERNVGLSALQPGDVVRMLVNQAVIEPGTVSESVKEIVIDAYGHQLANIYKGSLSTISDAQNTLSILDAYTLTKAGWTGYTPAKVLDLSDEEISYYMDDERISPSYAVKYLTNTDVKAYVATSDFYGDERVEKVSFRTGRDALLDYSPVTFADGSSQFKLLSQSGSLGVDEGTIVVKNGKIVQMGNLLSADYARVALNGGTQAAVIQIEPEPNNDAITVMRGRIAAIEDSESFQVQSNAILKDMTWVYSPVERTYNLSPDTRIYDAGGEIALEDFLTYGEATKIDEVYTIIAEGTQALTIVQNPYSKMGATGEVYQVDATTIGIKGVSVYDDGSQKWSTLSLTNNYALVDIPANAVIIKNNKTVTVDEIEAGDTLRVLTNEDLAEELKTSQTRNINGYVIFVE